MTDSPAPTIDELLADLAGDNAVEREGARHSLAAVGSPAVPGLLAALQDPRQHLRWEAAKTLAAIADPAAAQALVEAMDDEDADVRWVAGEAMIALKRDGLKPLLTALTKAHDSVDLYRAAHHVLHDLSQHGQLGELLAPVLKSLDQKSEPEVAVPVAALQALAQL